jgi:hypothetical protein
MSLLDARDLAEFGPSSAAFFRPSFHRQAQPAAASIVRLSAPRLSRRLLFGAAEAGATSSRYTSASGDVDSLRRSRRSGAGTHRVKYANASEPQTGQRWESWTSLQSRHRRAM